jgi:ankyrin repeat protein
MAMAQQISSQTETSVETKDSKRASTSKSLTGSSNQQWTPLSSFIRQSVLNQKDIPPYSLAVLSGNVAVLKKNKKKGKKINITEDAIGEPCCLLHYGILVNLKDDTRYHNLQKLISLGADLEQRDACDRTPLHFALLMGDMTAVDILFRAGCDVTAKCHGHNVVHLAAMSGNPDVFEMVRAAIARFDPSELTDYGFAAIHLAAMYNHDQMVATLVKHGADVNQCSEGILAAPQTILPVGGNVFQQYILQGLQGVARVVVEIRAASLLDKNVEMNEFYQIISAFCNNATSSHDEVIIHSLELAIRFGCFRVVKYLVDHGVDTGQLPLLGAAFSGDVEIVKYLFDHCGIPSRDSAEVHPVIMTAASGASNVVEFLVRCYDGSSIMLKSPDSQSEFSCMSLVDIACFMNRPEVLRLAIEMENNGSIYSSKRIPSHLLLLSIVGRWIMVLAAAAIPRFAPIFLASEEEQRAVVSAIADLPGCNLMEINPLVQTHVIHVAVALSQAAAVDAILDRLKGLAPAVIDVLGPPLLQLSVGSFYYFQQEACELQDKMLETLLSVGFPVRDAINTIDILLKHGHDINGIDVNGCTCLDYAVHSQIGEIQSFLLGQGALTRTQVENNQVEAQRILRLEKRAQQISLDNEKLTQENKDLLHENRMLRSQQAKQEELMHRMKDVVQEFLPLCSAFMGEPVGRSHSKEMPQVRLGDGKIIVLDDSDIRLMAAKWLEIGTFLGIHISVLDIIKMDHPNRCERACYEMLCQWSRKESHTGDQPRTLTSILLALARCGCEEYAKGLEKKHSTVV